MTVKKNKKTVSFSLTQETVDKIAELSFRSKIQKSAIIDLIIANTELENLTAIIKNEAK